MSQELSKITELLKGGKTHEEALKAKYSRFDADGMPTHDVEGNELQDKVRFKAMPAERLHIHVQGGPVVRLPATMHQS